MEWKDGEGGLECKDGAGEWSGRTEQENGGERTEMEKWTGAMEWEGGKEGRK